MRTKRLEPYVSESVAASYERDSRSRNRKELEALKLVVAELLEEMGNRCRIGGPYYHVGSNKWTVEVTETIFSPSRHIDITKRVRAEFRRRGIEEGSTRKRMIVFLKSRRSSLKESLKDVEGLLKLIEKKSA